MIIEALSVRRNVEDILQLRVKVLVETRKMSNEKNFIGEVVLTSNVFTSDKRIKQELFIIVAFIKNYIQDLPLHL